MKRTTKTLLIALIISAMLASCVPSEPVQPTLGSDASLSASESSEASPETSSETSSESSSETSAETSSESSSESSSEMGSESSSETGSETSSEVPPSSESSSAESSSSSQSEAEQKPDPQKTPYSEGGVTLSQTAVRQGCFMKIRVEGRDMSGATYEDIYGRRRGFFEFEGAWYSFLPIDPADEPGKYTLTIDLGDSVFEKKIEVIDRKFRQQYLEVKPSTLEETIENERVRAEFNEFVGEYLGYYSSEPLWGGKFMYPLGSAGYSETTKFGSFRTFSNGSTEWHNATDMAAAGGTPIYATNSGRIIYADHLGVSGNTVVIDHGAGVLSWHYHLSEITCSVGDYAAKGDQIGKVGTTGLSTGNHLHFGISVDGMFTDPMQIAGKQVRLDF